jgi:hypothetical protein
MPVACRDWEKGLPDARSLVAGVRHPHNSDSVVIYVSASSEAAANALARKLPRQVFLAGLCR